MKTPSEIVKIKITSSIKTLILITKDGGVEKLDFESATECLWHLEQYKKMIAAFEIEDLSNGKTYVHVRKRFPW